MASSPFSTLSQKELSKPLLIPSHPLLRRLQRLPCAYVINSDSLPGLVCSLPISPIFLCHLVTWITLVQPHRPHLCFQNSHHLPCQDFCFYCPIPCASDGWFPPRPGFQTAFTLSERLPSHCLRGCERPYLLSIPVFVGFLFRLSTT